jgi:tetratricopeptide (TPR) repeat protein
LSHSLHAYANVLQLTGRFAEAAPLYERALAIREHSYGADHSYVASTLTALATLYLEQGRYAEAELPAQRALQIWESKLGPDHPNTAAALSNMAQVYRFQKRYAEAEPLYRRAVDILQSRRSPDAAKPLANLGDFYFDRGRTAAALNLYKQAEAVIRAAFGDTDPQTKAVQLKIARLYEAIGRNTEAARLYKVAKRAPAGQGFQPAP